MWPTMQCPVDLVTFTEEILVENFIFWAVRVTFSEITMKLQLYVTALYHNEVTF